MLLLRIFGAAVLFGCLTTATRSSPGCRQQQQRRRQALQDGLNTDSNSASSNLTFTTSAGAVRSYLLHVPPSSSTTPASLIYSFHGRSRNASYQESLSQFSNPTFNPSAFAVYPQGIKDQWQGDPNATTDDVTFILELTDYLASRFCIDEDRIYAAGKSNGGGFAAKILACDEAASKRFAAFAGVSGAYYEPNVTRSNMEDGQASDRKASYCPPDTVPLTCHPGRSHVPVLEMHGDNDTTIPYPGGPRREECLPSVPHFVAGWAERNGFDAQRNKSTKLFDGGVRVYEWGSQDDNATGSGLVTHYKIHDLGHQWPSTVPNGDGGATFFDATPVIMEWFGRWSL